MIHEIIIIELTNCLPWSSKIVMTHRPHRSRRVQLSNIFVSAECIVRLNWTSRHVVCLGFDTGIHFGIDITRYPDMFVTTNFAR